MRVRLVVLLLTVLAVAGCGTSPVRRVADEHPMVTPPPAGVRWDYQLGGVRSVPDYVGIVTRDRTDEPLSGKYDVCYVNGFQTQDSEASYWKKSSRWKLVLKRHGKAVVDSGWGEWLLDTRTAKKRAALATIVGGWIDGCAQSGFQAVEIDNLDSFSGSHGLISKHDNLAFAALLIARAHDAGLAIGQKNWPELGAKGPAMGFDFAVAEECGQYDECDSYTAAYGAEVLAVEYTDMGFDAACAAIGASVSVVRRDRDVTPTGVRRWCP